MSRSAVLAAGLLLSAACAAPAEPLSAWSDGPARDRIIAFVAAVSEADSPAFVPPEERVAVFDNDGTLWSEEPWPVPFEFVLHRIRQLAPAHPEWRDKLPFSAALENDREWLRNNLRPALAQFSPLAQAGLTVDEYEVLVREFLATARHPATGLRYPEMVYEPMLQLVEFLQANGFQVYVVSGGDADFIRAYAPGTYGIPRSHVVGSRVKYDVDRSGETLRLVRLAERDTVNIGNNKILNLHTIAGQRPLFAAGNSDGDIGLLEYSVSPVRQSLQLLLVHDDEERAVVSSDASQRILRLAGESGWLKVSMKGDFGLLYRGETKDAED